MSERTPTPTRTQPQAASHGPTDDHTDHAQPPHTPGEWTRDIDDPDALQVGDRVTFRKPIDASTVERFGVVTGDTNPLHFDPEYAEQTRFDGRIAHGMLGAGVISAALAELPGGVTVYLSQDLRFEAPVDIGDEIEAAVEVVEEVGDDRYVVETVAEDASGTTVIGGEATVLIEEVAADA